MIPPGAIQKNPNERYIPIRLLAKFERYRYKGGEGLTAQRLRTWCCFYDLEYEQLFAGVAIFQPCAGYDELHESRIEIIGPVESLEGSLYEQHEDLNRRKIEDHGMEDADGLWFMDTRTGILVDLDMLTVDELACINIIHFGCDGFGRDGSITVHK